MATLTEFITNMTEVVSAISTMFVDVLSIFMEPPLVFFLGIGVFGAVAGIALRMIRGGKRS